MGRPRTRENFPAMKVRGGRRRRDARVEDAWRNVQDIDFAALGRAVENVGRAVVAFVDSVSHIADGIKRAIKVGWWRAQRTSRNHWIATHQLPAHPSPWAAPITQETP